MACNSISLILSFAGGTAVRFLGEWNFMLKALVTLLIIDYITGVIKAVYNKKLSSEIGFKGIIKKIFTIIVVGVANLIQGLVGDEVTIREIVIMFYIVNETISILENIAEVIPIPKKLSDILQELKKKE